MKKQTHIKLQILKESYWEHFKRAKDLALILDIKDPTRLKIESELNIIQQQIDETHDRNRSII
jgi:hypothetical protein